MKVIVLSVMHEWMKERKNEWMNLGNCMNAFSGVPNTRPFRACPVPLTLEHPSSLLSAEAWLHRSKRKSTRSQHEHQKPCWQLWMQNKTPYQPVANLWRPTSINKLAPLSAMPLHLRIPGYATEHIIRCRVRNEIERTQLVVETIDKLRNRI